MYLNNKVMKIKERYLLNKGLKVGDECICPSCGSSFIKSHYQQSFCKTKGGTVCKDKYWNTVTPLKRNNTKRISPASANWIENRKKNRKKFTTEGYEIIGGTAYDEWDEPIYDDDHAFSSSGLGQWV